MAIPHAQGATNQLLTVSIELQVGGNRPNVPSVDQELRHDGGYNSAGKLASECYRGAPFFSRTKILFEIQIGQVNWTWRTSHSKRHDLVDFAHPDFQVKELVKRHSLWRKAEQRGAEGVWPRSYSPNAMRVGCTKKKPAT